MSVPCPYCRQQLAFNAHVAGKQCKCYRCGRNFRLPLSDGSITTRAKIRNPKKPKKRNLHLEKLKKAELERKKAVPVAKWMASELSRDGRLSQRLAVRGIREKFGNEFTYRNENGNWAIARNVNAIFRKLTEKWAVWDGICWRKRESSDDPTSRRAK